MTHSNANILNESTLALLIASIGLEETRSMVISLMGQAASSAGDLQSAIDRRDTAAMQHLTYRIKAATSTLGCDALHTAIEDVEKDALEGSHNPQQYAETLALMRASGERVLNFINGY